MDQEHRVALKFAYDGSLFHGFQRQPNLVTVEGDLVRAMSKVGVIKSHSGCGYRGSSRTDTGVSALGNIISFRTSFKTDEICSAINSKMEGIWAYSAVDVPDTFNPRGARQRWYRYYLAKSDHNMKLMEEIAKRFVGVHDFSGYVRRDKRNPMRKIDSIEISDAGIFHALDFKAESFLWNMVRRIVWMMNEGSSGRLALDSIGPGSAKKPVRIGLAPPEYLVLMDIDCGIQFPVDRHASIGIARAIDRRLRENGMKLTFSRSVRELLK